MTVVGECNATYKAITWERATHKRCSERQVAQCRLELGAALEREVSNMHVAQAENRQLVADTQDAADPLAVADCVLALAAVG